MTTYKITLRYQDRRATDEEVLRDDSMRYEIVFVEAHDMNHAHRVALEDRTADWRVLEAEAMAWSGIVRWKRHRDGDGTTVWATTIGGRYVTVRNMQGQSVRHSGLGAHVEVRAGGDGPFSHNARTVHWDWTVRDAKAWAVDRYGRNS